MAWALSVTETFAYGVLFYSFAVFLVPMREALDASTAQLSAALSLAMGVTGVAAVGVGRWLDRHGPRWLMTGGSLLGGASVVAWSQARDLTHLYLAFVGVGLAGAAVLYEPAFALINTWFRRGPPGCAAHPDGGGRLRLHHLPADLPGAHRHARLAVGAPGRCPGRLHRAAGRAPPPGARRPRCAPRRPERGAGHRTDLLAARRPGRSVRTRRCVAASGGALADAGLGLRDAGDHRGRGAPGRPPPPERCGAGRRGGRGRGARRAVGGRAGRADLAGPAGGDRARDRPAGRRPVPRRRPAVPAAATGRHGALRAAVRCRLRGHAHRAGYGVAFAGVAGCTLAAAALLVAAERSDRGGPLRPAGPPAPAPAGDGRRRSLRAPRPR
ncbi:hypothetical protein SAMN05661080_01066 [Modestobacter sp. DSM 44400]|nr:hypothetical protein SAMN05661080_01066 [Modestobacter sp. DSM 44400]